MEYEIGRECTELYFRRCQTSRSCRCCKSYITTTMAAELDHPVGADQLRLTRLGPPAWFKAKISIHNTWSARRQFKARRFQSLKVYMFEPACQCRRNAQSQTNVSSVHSQDPRKKCRCKRTGLLYQVEMVSGKAEVLYVA